MMNVAAALSFEGFRANSSPLDPRVQTARSARGQQAAATALTQLLFASALWQPNAARRVQDPLSFRCVTQVHGAALQVAWTARDCIEMELNSATESPLVLVDDEVMSSNGNVSCDRAGCGIRRIASRRVSRT